MVYNILRVGTAPCLYKTFSARSKYNDYNLRGYDTELLFLKLKKNFQKKFKYKDAILLNNLFHESKCAPTI